MIKLHLEQFSDPWNVISARVFKKFSIDDTGMKRMRLHVQIMVGENLLKRTREQNLGEFAFVVGIGGVVKLPVDISKNRKFGV